MSITSIPRLQPRLGFARRQEGVALVIGLVFLLITTLMAVTAMSGVVMQERMAGNLRNVSIATSGAESALRAGELYLINLIARGEQPIGDCAASDSHSIYNRDSVGCGGFIAADNFRSARDWLESPPAATRDYPSSLISSVQLGSHEGAGMARRPQFLIEHLGDLNPPAGEWNRGGRYDPPEPVPRAYRITGRSTGASVTVVRSSESAFGAVVGGGDGTLCPDGSVPDPDTGCDDP